MSSRFLMDTVPAHKYSSFLSPLSIHMVSWSSRLPFNVLAKHHLHTLSHALLSTVLNCLVFHSSLCTNTTQPLTHSLIILESTALHGAWVDSSSPCCALNRSLKSPLVKTASLHVTYLLIARALQKQPSCSIERNPRSGHPLFVCVCVHWCHFWRQVWPLTTLDRCSDVPLPSTFALKLFHTCDSLRRFRPPVFLFSCTVSFSGVTFDFRSCFLFFVFASPFFLSLCLRFMLRFLFFSNFFFVYVSTFRYLRFVSHLVCKSPSVLQIVSSDTKKKQT